MIQKDKIKEIECPCGNKVKLTEPTLEYDLELRESYLVSICGESYLVSICECGQRFIKKQPKDIILND